MTDPVIPNAEAPARVAVTLSDGQSGYVDEGDVQSVVASGGTVGHTGAASLSEGAQADQGELGGLAGSAAAFGFGGLRSATLGLSDPALIGLSGLVGGEGEKEHTRRGLSELRELHPGMSTAGEVAGLFTPGGIGGKVAKGFAHAAESGVAKLGTKAIEAAGLSPEAFGAFSRVAAKAGLAGVGGAAEGALYGAGNVVSEDALGDHELTAEQLLAGAGEGGLVGLGAGGLIGGLGAAGGELYGGVSALGRGAAGQAADALGGATDLLATGRAKATSWLDRLGSHSSAAEGVLRSPSSIAEELAQEGTPRGLESMLEPGATGGLIPSLAEKVANAQAGSEASSAFKRAYRDATKLADSNAELDKLAISTAEDVSKPLRESDAAIRDAWGEHKVDTLAKYADPTRVDEQMTASSKIASEIQQTVDYYRDINKNNSLGIGGTLKKLDAWNDVYTNRVLKAGALPDSAEIFRLTDNLKRTLAEPAQFGRNIGGSPDVQAALRRFDELYHSARTVLEDPTVWGERVAAGQKAVNEGWVARLNSADKFRDAFTENFGAEAGRPISRFDAGKLKAFFASPDGAEAYSKNQAMAEYISGQRQLMDSLEAHGDLSASARSKIEKGRVALDTLEQRVAQAKAESADIANLKRAKELELSSAVPGLLGVVTDVITRPIATAERLGQLELAKRQVSERMASAVDGIAKGTTGRPIATPSRTDLVRAARSVIDAAAAPQAIMENVQRRLRGIADAAPRTSQAFATSAVKAVTYLAARAPKDISPADPLALRKREPRYDEGQLQQFGRVLATVKDPIGATERAVKDGTLTWDHVDALQTVYPKLYDKMRVDVLEAVQRRADPLSYADRILLGILFRAPTDPSLRPEYVRAIQQTKAPPAPDPQNDAQKRAQYGRQGKPIDFSGSQTETEKIAGGSQ